jgi:hypothetical protein
MIMKTKSVGPVEVFKPAIVWRASQCGWLRVEKTRQGLDIWEKPNGDLMFVKQGVEPLVPMRPAESPNTPAAMCSTSLR